MSSGETASEGPKDLHIHFCSLSNSLPNLLQDLAIAKTFVQGNLYFP